MNMYIALFYRHGKPSMGRAWNEMGQVQCEFAVDKKVLHSNDIRDNMIQLLCYEGTHVTNKFFYEWYSIGMWKQNSVDPLKRQVVRCGSSTPLYWEDRNALGHYDHQRSIGTFVIDGKYVEIFSTTDLDRMTILSRNFVDAPVNCPCETCMANRKQDNNAHHMLMDNEWIDFCCGHPWPRDKRLVRALGRDLKTPKGPQPQFVGMWYRHGKAMMGRVWPRLESTAIDACFIDSGHEFTGIGVGSVQMLHELPATTTGFEYCWLPYDQVSRLEPSQKVQLVHLNHRAPCVINYENGYEVLGQVDMKEGRAEASFAGKLFVVEGIPLNKMLVLCRRENEDIIAI